MHPFQHLGSRCFPAFLGVPTDASSSRADMDAERSTDGGGAMGRWEEAVGLGVFQAPVPARWLVGGCK